MCRKEISQSISGFLTPSPWSMVDKGRAGLRGKIEPPNLHIEVA